MCKKGFMKIVNFLTPGAGDVVLRHDHMSFSENALPGIDQAK